MDVLVIGGTQFVGVALTEELRWRGHGVTHFNRGQTRPEGVEGVETVVGDRKTDLGRLAGRRWDAVVDVCGYLPGDVGQSAEALSGSVGRYLFVSTISVYEAPGEGGRVEEDGALLELVEDTGVVDGGTYGPYKVLCEREVERVYGGRGTVVRPGLIVGPGDHTERFAYWPVRAAEGGIALVPDALERGTTALDVRDFAGFMVGLLESETAGVFNVDRRELRFGDVLEACAPLGDWERELVDESFLEGEGVRPWVDLPCWLPATGIALPDVGRALAAGLRERPLAETARDTLAWAQARGLARPLKAGLTSEREQELLEKWRLSGRV